MPLTSQVQIALPSWLQDYSPPLPVTNVYYQRTRQESCAWIRQYKVLSGKAQTIHEANNAEMLAALAYPYCGYEILRLACDLMSTLFVVDDATDHQGLHDVRKTCDLLLSATRSPGAPHSSNVAKAMADFMERYNKAAGPSARARMLSHIEAYLEAVVTQASLREQKRAINSVDAFSVERRENAAIKICFDFIEPGLGIDLPPFVYESKFMDIYVAAADIVWISNDVYSYSMEKSIGHRDYNICTVYMKEYNLDLQGAFDHADREFRRLWTQLQNDRKALPSFGDDIDRDVDRVIDGLLQWVVGNLLWSFETPRYFGDLAHEIRATHTIVV